MLTDDLVVVGSYIPVCENELLMISGFITLFIAPCNLIKLEHIFFRLDVVKIFTKESWLDIAAVSSSSKSLL